MKKTAFLFLIFAITSSCTNPADEKEADISESIENPTNEVLLSSDIVWEKLNPARGDKSPQAGTVWGNRKGEVATGFLAKFVDGFSSPPHIHNVSYRAIVLEGLVHNDDSAAANMWMPPGSFWTQPAGEAHITSAKGEKNIAYVEIDSGPYLVNPASEATDNGERPINIDASNVVWLGSSETSWIESESKAEISFLWEKSEGELRGCFVKFPQGFNGMLVSEGDLFRSIVVSGELEYVLPQNDVVKALDVGSSFFSSDRAVHSLSNNSKTDVIVYIRTNGEFSISD